MNRVSSSHHTTLLKIENVTKNFSDFQALKGISLDVREGEFLTLLGPSGCGKTTLIRIIAGFETPTAGDIRIDGQSILSSPPYRRPLGMVFQSLALFPHLTVGENIAYGLKVRRQPKSDISRRVNEALQMVGLEGMGGRYIGQISGGQKQRVALARAVVTEPRVLLLDEPLGALDLKIRRQMQTELKQIQERLGTTFIFVTHDQEEALTMSDRVAVFRNGELEQVDTPSVIYRNPSTRFVAEFVGDTNFFEGAINAHADGTLLFTSSEFPQGIELNGVPYRHGSKVGVSLRPQYLKVTDVDSGRISAVVNRKVYAGQSTRLWLQAGRRILIADISSCDEDLVPDVGEQVGLTWSVNSLSVIGL